MTRAAAPGTPAAVKAASVTAPSAVRAAIRVRFIASLLAGPEANRALFPEVFGNVGQR
jgi:hypothetical protein